MAKKILSPGQKKRRWIIAIMVSLTLAVSALIACLPTAAEREARMLEQSHDMATATLTAVTDEVSEYTGRKGRRMTEHDYSADYDFALQGEQLSGHAALSAAEYRALNEGEQIEIWFPKDQPALSMPKMVADRLAVSTPIDRLSPYIRWILPAAAALTTLMLFLFGREPKGVLPEGFYTENSWLDVDDKYLVYLTDDHLYSISIGKNEVGAIQRLYQNGATIDKLLAEAGGKHVSIPLAAISEVESHFHKDTLEVTYVVDGKTDYETLEFLNPAVKRHAAEQIGKALPPHMNREDVQKGRLQSALPALIVSLVLGAAIYFVHSTLVHIIAILLLLWCLKVVLTRLLRPVALTRWSLPVAPKPAELVS
jgi:hypothetical protein